MQLRTRITLLLVAVLTVSMIVNYAIQRVAVAPSFRVLEHDDAIKDWERCKAAITRDSEALSALCFDWASWDDAYGFVQDKNPAFFDANLKNEDWFTDQKIDVLYFCRPDGTVYWSHLATLESGAPASLAWMPSDRLPAGHPLLAVKPDKESKIDGLVHTELGFMLVSSRPILTSKNEGPLAGVLVFARRITAETVDVLRTQTSVHFDLMDMTTAGMNAAENPGMAAAIASDSPVEELVDSTRLAVRGVMKGLDNKPVMLIQTTGERRISKQGNDALNMATVSLLGAGLLTLVALLLSMGWLVLGPLGALTRHATEVGKSGRLEGRVNLKRADELGALARAFDDMLTQLDEFRANSVALSRQAGMAEVAAGVLHNVGNAMTNVNILAETVAGKLAKSKAPNLSKVSALLNENQKDLPGLFRDGGKGQQLPGYITQLADHLKSEMVDLQQDLAGLRDGLQHVKAIVASHQDIASKSNFLEEADLADVIAKSLLIVEASLQKHGVAVEVDAQPHTLVTCDFSKVSQVMVNLLTNAKDAMVAANTLNPRIQVRVGRDGKGTAFIEVSDNGPGVSPENRHKLFGKGFTTKAQGHGIGLHYCWLAIREMNGTLSLAESNEGPGATFRLEMPTHIGAERVAA